MVDKSIYKAFKVLSNPTRLDIFLEILAEACSCDLDNENMVYGNCVTSIAKKLELPQPTVSNHVKELMNADLIDSHRRGKNIYLFGNEETAKKYEMFSEFFLEQTEKTAGV